MIRHASTAVLLHWMRDNVPDEERAAVLGSTSINFDVSVAEIFGTLCWGGTLVLVENALDLPRRGATRGSATPAWSPRPRRSCCAPAASRPACAR